MFNEQAGVENCVRSVCGQLASLPRRTALIAVEDGSRDDTLILLRNLEREYALLTVVAHERNRGYGAALQTGIRHAKQAGFDYVLFMDSDLTNDPRDIPKFVSRMDEGYDVIKATRYSLGGAVRGVPRYRVVISRIGNRIARFLFRLPVNDSTNGFRAVKLELLARMRLAENRFPIIMEELYWAKFIAQRFIEVPVILTSRDVEQRPTSFVYTPAMFHGYLKYPLRAFWGRRPAALNKAAELSSTQERKQ